MNIVQVEPIVLRRPGEINAASSDTPQYAFLVRIRTDDGLVGVGSATTAPFVARTIIEMPASHAISRGFAELLLGEDPLDTDRLWEKMFRGSYWYGRSGAAIHALSAIDMALWDIRGQVEELPLSHLLGTRRHERITAYASEIMPDDPDGAEALAAKVSDAGYRGLKLGWGPLGSDIGRDVELIAAARSGLEPDQELMIDGGMAYTVDTALELLTRTATARLSWFEEPLAADDYSGYRALSALTDVPLAAGEADSTLVAFEALLESGVRILQPDLGRCGGPTIARRVVTLAEGSAAWVVPHCFGPGIMVAASLHLVSTLERPLFAEFSVADSPLVRDLLEQPFLLDGGQIQVPDKPGLGVTLNEEAVARMRV